LKKIAQDFLEHYLFEENRNVKRAVQPDLSEENKNLKRAVEPDLQSLRTIFHSSW
jgi:hypothetical protein